MIYCLEISFQAADSRQARVMRQKVEEVHAKIEELALVREYYMYDKQSDIYQLIMRCSFIYAILYNVGRTIFCEAISISISSPLVLTPPYSDKLLAIDNSGVDRLEQPEEPEAEHPGLRTKSSRTPAAWKLAQHPGDGTRRARTRSWTAATPEEAQVHQHKRRNPTDVTYSFGYTRQPTHSSTNTNTICMSTHRVVC